MNDVPGYFSSTEQLEIIKLLSKYNYTDCVGVEVGCLHGRSSIAISIAINKGTLYCIDRWLGNVTYYKRRLTKDQQGRSTVILATNGFDDNDKFITGHNLPGPDCVNSVETFIKYTESQKNIIPIRGSSPRIVQDWSKSIDFIFLDAEHYNPNDRDNIDFWLPKIKPGGMFSGHDWVECANRKFSGMHIRNNIGFPDVNLNVEYMEDFLKQKVTIIPNTSIWYFILPKS